MSIPPARQEPWRPQLHFSPHRNWINDPNGLVWFEGEYHLFFQYNPQGSEWGHMSWGHAVSPDLVNWTELPVALEEDARAMVFSGSVVVDTHNTCGLGVPGQPVLVACYTAHLLGPAQAQVQDLAYSTDRGRTWRRYAGNPVLDIQLKDFRDPKVFWHGPSGQWVMVVVVPDEREARFYGSPNLLRWTELSRFRAPLPGQGIWECPDLIELPVEGGTTVWMLKVDTFGGHPSGETGARLFFGHFDGQRFTPDPGDDEPRWADYGSDFYAALSWGHLPADPWRGQAVWLAWMSCHRYAAQVPTQKWRGSMTLPRQLRARRSAHQWRLVQEPIPQLSSLRGTPVAHDAHTLGPAAPAQVLWSNEEPTPLPESGGPQSTCLELESAIRSVYGGQAVLRMVWTPRPMLSAEDPAAQVVEVGYDALKGALYIDRSRSGLIPKNDQRFAGRRWAPCRRPSTSQPLSLRVWWDWSSVEVIADDGCVALTELIFPRGDFQRLEWVALNGTAQVGATTVWPLRAASMA